VCGAGVPISSRIADKGHRVIGVDISPRQIELAKTNVPNGEFMVRDMLDLKQREVEVDAVISFYAIFHTPRESHAALLRVLASFLSEGGLLLVTMGADEWEGGEDFFGAPMWWSHYGPKKNRQIVESSGFDVISDEIDPSDGERHQVIFARKR
jgi:SAM-dependent methyltransferase